MDKYELHNQRQMEKYRADEFRPMPYFINGATFDLFEKNDPTLLDCCMVSMWLPAAPEEQVEKYSIFSA